MGIRTIYTCDSCSATTADDRMPLTWRFVRMFAVGESPTETIHCDECTTLIRAIVSGRRPEPNPEQA